MMADGLSRNGPASPSNMTWPVQHGICSWVKPSLWGKHLRWTKLSRQDENTFESFAAAAKEESRNGGREEDQVWDAWNQLGIV